MKFDRNASEFEGAPEIKDGVIYLHPEDDAGPYAPDVETALDKISRHVNGGSSMDEVIQCVWEATADIIPRDRISVSFIEEEGSRVASRYFKADYSDVLLNNSYSAPLAGSSLEKVIRSGVIRIIVDLDLYLKTHPKSKSTKLLVHEGVRSNITLPLRVGDRRVGFLFFSSKKPRAFGREHARMLLAVQRRIAQAVEKAWIITRLENANRNYLSMLGFVAHELKGPLANITSKATTYLSGYLGDVDPMAASTMKGILKTTDFLSGMVNDYLDYAQFESGDMKYQPRENVKVVEDVLNVAIDAVSAHAARRTSRIKLEAPKGDLRMTADARMLMLVVVNLLDNALKYGKERQTVLVSAALEGSELLIRIRNEGVGFNEEQRKRLFRRFSRLRQKGTEDRKGSGLGLYLARLIVSKHKGRLDAASEAGKWAEFTLRLPDAYLF
jgi:hypothetical protein